MTEVVSEWIRPGWYLAMCADCNEQPAASRSLDKRDEWAARHTLYTGHFVEKLRGTS